MKKQSKLHELFLRLKHWLIKKLGGYVARRMPLQERQYIPTPLHPERVCCHARFDLRESIDPDEERRRLEALKEELIYRCVKQIIEKDMCVLTCEPDRAGRLSGFPESKIYTVTLCLVPPREWVKTTMGDFLDPGNMRRGMLYYRESKNQASHP